MKFLYVHHSYTSVLEDVCSLTMGNKFKVFRLFKSCTNSISIQMDHNRSLIDQTPERV